MAAAGGHLQRTVKGLAEELGIKPERLYYLLRVFEQQGLITTVSHGPLGLEIRPGQDGTAASPQSGDRAAAPRVASRYRYCPYCGQESAADWRFCTACGRALPAPR